MDIADEEAIYSALPGFLRSVRSKTHPLPRNNDVYSRHTQVRRLADCFDGLIASQASTS